MVRSELVAALSRENPGLTTREVNRVVDIVFDSISEALSAGGRADFRGFGVFSTRDRPAREVRNPKDGTYRMAPAQRVVHFRAGRGISQRINASTAAADTQATGSPTQAAPENAEASA